jgi:hypothetical protein
LLAGGQRGTKMIFSCCDPQEQKENIGAEAPIA